MGLMAHLPTEIATFLELHFVTEYASVSAAGVPIDTPLIVIWNEAENTFDVATGLAYPIKAERARRNPKVGLLLEGGPNGPVVSIAGMARVQDHDLQANMNRYLSEVINIPIFSPERIDYQAITRKAVWYFSRIMISIAPVHVRWWPNPAAMDEAPKSWRAPAGTVFPASDPAPSGKPSAAPQWSQATWRELAQGALERGAAGHLSLLDAEGFPLPIRVSGVTATDEGFRFAVPKGAPWSGGKATLSFEGREMFVGDAAQDGGGWRIKVERALPVLPLTSDPTQVLQPTPETQTKLMERLAHEAQRRGQPIPQMPAEPLEPTPGAKKRAAAALAYTESHPGSEG